MGMPFAGPSFQKGSLAELRAVLDAVSDGVVVADASGEVLIANRAAREMHGVSAREALRGLHQHAREWELRACGGQALSEEQWPLARVLRGEQVVEHDVEVVHRASGAARVLRAAGSRVATPDGRELAVLTLRDVTTVRAIEEELQGAQSRAEKAAADARRKAAKLDAVLSAVAEGVVVYGADGAVLRANEQAVEYFGLTPERCRLPLAERLRCLKLQYPGERPVPAEDLPVLRALRGQQVEPTLLLVDARAVGGRARWLKMSAAPILDRTRAVERVVLTAADVTALKELEERREQMLRILAHDLRTPLNAVLLQAELLLQQVGSVTGARRLAEALLASAERIAGILRELGDQVRFVSGSRRRATPGQSG